MKKQRGLYITFEGNEGSGKGTVIQKLAEYLVIKKINFYFTREPGGSAIGEKIREIVTKNKNIIEPLAELLLFIANRAQNIQKIVAPRKNKGQLVISDRGLDSSVVYQGAARRIPLKIVKYLNNLAVGNNLPNYTIILLVDPVVGLKRVRNQNRAESKVGKLDRIESENLEFHYKLYNGYKKLAKTSKRYILIDTTNLTPDEVFQKVQDIFDRIILPDAYK